MSNRKASPDGRYSLLMVDDHAIVREGLKRVLEPIANQWVITEAGTAFEALDCLRKHHFDLAIVDLSMPGMGGLDLIRRVKAEFPSVAVLVLSMHGEAQYAMRSFKAGANGYVTKDSASTELVVAVRKVAAGGELSRISLAIEVATLGVDAVPTMVFDEVASGIGGADATRSYSGAD